MTHSEMEVVFELMGVRVRGRGKNVSIKCPLAAWTHTRGRDRHPSVTASPQHPIHGIAVFKCWSCQEHGSVRKLAKTYGDYCGDYRAYEYACQIEGVKINPWNSISKPNMKFEDRLKYVGKRITESMPKVLTEEDLKKYLEDFPNYATERGMTSKEILKWEIGYDKKERRMVFPIRDHKKKLAGISGRALANQRPKYKHYYGLKKENYLYGESFVESSWGKSRGYLVEGFFDVIFLSRTLKNVLATMGTSLSDTQTKKIAQWFNEVVLIPDMDGPGLKFFAEIARKLFVAGLKVGVAGVQIVNYDEKQLAYEFKAIDGLDEKDPGDFTGEELDAALKNIVWFSVERANAG